MPKTLIPCRQKFKWIDNSHTFKLQDWGSRKSLMRKHAGSTGMWCVCCTRVVLALPLCGNARVPCFLRCSVFDLKRSCLLKRMNATSRRCIHVPHTGFLWSGHFTCVRPGQNIMSGAMIPHHTSHLAGVSYNCMTCYADIPVLVHHTAPFIGSYLPVTPSRV